MLTDSYGGCSKMMILAISGQVLTVDSSASKSGAHTQSSSVQPEPILHDILGTVHGCTVPSPYDNSINSISFKNGFFFLNQFL